MPGRSAVPAAAARGRPRARSTAEARSSEALPPLPPVSSRLWLLGSTGERGGCAAGRRGQSFAAGASIPTHPGAAVTEDRCASSDVPGSGQERRYALPRGEGWRGLLCPRCSRRAGPESHRGRPLLSGSPRGYASAAPRPAPSPCRAGWRARWQRSGATAGLPQVLGTAAISPGTAGEDG